MNQAMSNMANQNMTGLELKIPELDVLREIYQRDLVVSFPASELKPLSNILTMWQRGRYQPWCLYKDGEIIGECFLWDGRPGWALLDYLCITPRYRNAGWGKKLLQLMRETLPELTIFGEAETPDFAPEPETARRRLEFYRRCGARFGENITTEVFGVVYSLFYWSDQPVSDETLAAECEAVYRSSFLPEKYAKYIRIPRDPKRPVTKLHDWI